MNRRAFLGTAACGLASLGKLSALPLEQIKLGVTTDEIDEDPAVAAKFLKEHGLRWGEVRNIWGKYNTAQPVAKVREAKAIFDEHGIRVSVEGTGFFKIALPENDAALEEQWTLLNNAMDRARLLGTDKLRIFAFTYKGQAEAKAYPRVYELLNEAARRAKAKEMRLAVENVGGSYVATGAQAGEMLKRVKADNFGLTWDPNNAGMSGEKAFPEGYGKLDPARIFHVHLRDYKRDAQGKVEWAAVGEGEFDNLGQIKSLLGAGYRGTFTLETHWKSPQGKAFATDYSLKGLLKVIEKL